MAAKKSKRGRPRQTEITSAQRRTLSCIREFIAKSGMPPTMQELAGELGIKPPSAYEQVRQLASKGYIEREPGKARGLKVVREREADIPSLTALLLLGTVKAGQPVLAEENVVGEILVEDNIAKRGSCFALIVSGDSMAGAGMRDGDIVIVRQQPVAESGEVVVALLNNESTVKRLHVRGDCIELRPHNRRYKPIPIRAGDDLRIVGKVVAIRNSKTKRDRMA